MFEKKVSIILCFYNEEKYLAQAIDSVLAQTYSNFELILINDGSTDRSEEIVRSYDDPRIIYISYEGNKHQAYARNRGLDIAAGDYIGFFDGDDIMMPSKLEKQVDFLNHNQNIILVSGGYVGINAEGEEGEIYEPQFMSDEQIKAYMLYGNCIAFAGAALLRREIIDQYNIRFDENNKYCEDYQFFIELLLLGKIANVKEIFFKYRINYGSKSSLIVKENEHMNDTEIRKVLEMAWNKRGLCLKQDEILFIHEFLYKRVRIWKARDIYRGVAIYRKIRKQLEVLKLKESRLILQYYRQKWMETYQLYWLFNKIFKYAR